MLAYLRPHGFVHIHRLLAHRLVRSAEHSPPAAVPVVVDDDVHVRIQRPVDHLVNTVHKPAVDGVVAALKVHAVSPGYRNAYRVESGVLHTLDHFLGGGWLPP